MVSRAHSGKESHGIFWSQDAKFIFVTSKHANTITCFEFNHETGAIEPRLVVNLPDGSGCRHFAFHPAG
jgi:6-phosphogluconolactonase (cycloisomerase 2 family)